MLQRSWLGLLLLGLATCGGCGGGAQVFPASGKAVYADGSPVPGAVVIFEPAPGSPYSVQGTIKNGDFSLSTTDGHGNAQQGARRETTASTWCPLPRTRGGRKRARRSYRRKIRRSGTVGNYLEDRNGGQYGHRD